ncbi:MAG: hypothetical protein ABIJ46_00330, partial [bacterium]
MPYFFFSEDYDHLGRQVADLKEKIRAAYADAADSAEQSSETWHDNFGFEDGQRQIMMLGHQLEKLAGVMNRAELLEHRPAGKRVEIGSTVRVLDEVTDEEA